MRILIDTLLLQRTPTGMEYYLADLLEAIPEVDPENQYYLTPEHKNSQFRNFYKTFPHKARISFHLIHYPAFYWRSLGPSARVVFTVHDLLYLSYPKEFPRGLAIRLARQQREMIEKAAGVITCTPRIKQEVVKFLGISPGRVYVVPLAPAPLFRPVRDAAALAGIRKKYGLRTFLLCVSSFTPRKNLPFLVRAFALLKKEKSFQDLQLVLVGKQDGIWGSRIASEIQALATQNGIIGDVLCPGYVSRQDLPVLYSAASLFVYPSVYEGFGLPPLEAMASGCPAVVLRDGVAPEVAGTGALVIEPGEPDTFAAGIAELLGDPERLERQKEAGFNWVQQFSWQRTARETVAVYRHLTGQK
ncbi:MAG: glycosyltransferase family 1 protein [Bacillota bacterium]|nr:glycosyltransferase family 1 protein [Bacillota bacterium]